MQQMQLIPMDVRAEMLDQDTFNESDFTEQELAFLDGQEKRIYNINNRAVKAIGTELIRVRQWFEQQHKRGFESWAQQRLGLNRRTVYNWMQVAKLLEQTTDPVVLMASLRTQLKLAQAPDPQAALEEAAARAHLDGGRVTEDMAKEIKAAQEALLLAQDEKKEAQDKLGLLQGRVAYLEQQLGMARKAQQEEREVEGVNVEERIAQLSQQLEEALLLARTYEDDARRARDELAARPVQTEVKEVLSPELTSKLKAAEQSNKQLRLQLEQTQEKVAELTEQVERHDDEGYEERERQRVSIASELEHICSALRTWGQRAKTFAAAVDAYGQYEWGLIHDALVYARTFSDQLEAIEAYAQVQEDNVVESEVVVASS